MMNIFIDADSCPLPCKDIIIRLAYRSNIYITFVANKVIKLPNYKSLRFILSTLQKNAADYVIINLASENDIIITSDKKLTSSLVNKNAIVISPYGEVFTKYNFSSMQLGCIKSQDAYQYYGNTQNKPTFSKKHKANFANALDSILAKLNKEAKNQVTSVINTAPCTPPSHSLD
ncbi:MAG: DUF188 domain-containing protein [Agitococcus sp.]